ncbi:hypothetical protein EMIT051CA3_50123 [Pseudomonas chlororaphis]
MPFTVKLPPKSVGASVDKVFAFVYGPLNTWLTGCCSKNDQGLVEKAFLDKSRIFFRFYQRIRRLKAELPTFAVGGDVDNLFAEGWGPCRPWPGRE